MEGGRGRGGAACVIMTAVVKFAQHTGLKTPHDAVAPQTGNTKKEDNIASRVMNGLNTMEFKLFLCSVLYSNHNKQVHTYVYINVKFERMHVKTKIQFGY